MKTGPEAFKEHEERLKRAIHLEKPVDRVPIMLSADLFTAKYADPSVRPVDFCERTDWAYSKTVEGLLKLGGGEIDAVNILAGNPAGKGFVFFSKSKIPGRDLPPDALWQIDEVGVMQPEDYDFLLTKGWNSFFEEMTFHRLGYDPNSMEETIGQIIRNTAEYEEAGIIQIFKATAAHPFEQLCSARGVKNFLLDLHRIPEKVAAALDVIFEAGLEQLVGSIRMLNPLVVMTSFTRASDDFISRKHFEKFVWPYVLKHVNIIVKEGCNAFFHMDSKWDNKLDYFRELPKGRCVFDPDSLTDIFRIKDVLGGHMCITGDVSPSMLCLGTPGEVYSYCTKLIREIGPEGFIMSIGCNIPPNAKPENVEAIVLATHGK